MKKLFSCLLLGTIVSPAILIKANADTNPYDNIVCNYSSIGHIADFIDKSQDCADQQNQAIDENAFDVNTNLNSIQSNITNITSNDTDISTNQTNITNNFTNITSNDTDISTNQTNITNNSTNITSNDTDISTNQTNITNNSTNITSNDTDISTNQTNITNNATNITNLQSEVNSLPVQTKSGSTTTTVVGDSTRNILEVGTGTNPTQIHQSGINVNGQNLISTDANGVTKLGANSLNFQTVNGKENLWGTDASGNIIPLNISNGSKLLINGRDVEQSIDNVGALSAALTGLPTVPIDSKFTCGVGTGAHGGNFAVSGGCATKVSERLTMNFAGSLIPTSQDYQGAGNDWSGRADSYLSLARLISQHRSAELKRRK